jgi:endonuclease YncB( thermonuclease family)
MGGLADQLCSLWVERAPRFGAVAAHFPESLRKRRFVAATSSSISGRVDIETEMGPDCFWSPELPEVTVLEEEGVRCFCVKRSEQGGSFPWWPLAYAFLLLLCLALPAGAQTLAGTVSRVTDGDTLVVGHVRVRLHGIDAPEGSQTCVAPSRQAYRCGDSAEGFLARMAPPGAAITCEVLDSDRYGRLVARCVVAGRDLSAWMVRSGWAVAFRRYSLDYVALEDEARAGHRGMWAGSFVVPELWRKGVR